MVPLHKIFQTVGLVFGLSALPALAQLETRASVPVNSSPYSIAVGDFNRDGKKDLAVVAFSSGKVAVLLGNGDGTFQKAIYYDAVASSVAAADFRNNGILDLAFTDNLSNNLQVLLGNGDGTFGPSVFYASPDFPDAIGVGDFNGDHNLDVVTIEESGYCHCISVFLGNGDGTFQQPPISMLPPTPPVAIGIGDFNRDGNLDLVAVGQFGSPGQADILMGNGDGTFTLGDSYAIGSDPQSVAVADFNGDHILDLAIADAESGDIDILLGNGDGTFRQGPVISGLAFPGAIQKGDFNGDGKVDLAFLTGVHSTVLNVLLGNGDGSFKPAMTFPLPGESAAIASADFNGDHRNDIVVADYLGNAVITLLNTGVVTFSPTTPLNFNKQAAGTTSAPQTVTLTNTGKTDLKIASVQVAGQFAMTSTCEKSVAAGANCSISITFSPKTKGPKSGAVSIIDSASSKPQVIELSGTGT